MALDQTCLEAEGMIQYDEEFGTIRKRVLAAGSISAAESVASSAGDQTSFT